MFSWLRRFLFVIALPPTLVAAHAQTSSDVILHGAGDGALELPFGTLDRPWSNYQIIIWQPETAEQYSRLRQLGITAGEVHVYNRNDPAALADAQAAPLLQAGLAFYVENIATDFYSAYHRWFPNRPVNWRFRDVKARYSLNPSDPFALIRDPSLSDPRWLARIERRLALAVRANREHHPLYYALGDETGIADLSAFWDFDMSTPSLDAMRRWLRHRYGSLAALNAEWGSRFPTWSAVSPMLTRAAVAQPSNNFAAWSDFKEWMDVAFARALRDGTDAIHRADPKAKSAIEGAQVAGWGGYDYWRLAHAADVFEIYDDGSNLELVRSFNPQSILLTTLGGAGPDAIHALWRELLRGTRGVILWNPNSDIVREDGSLGLRGRELAPVFDELRNGVGALLINSDREIDPIAILYSPESFRLQWMLDWKPRGAAWSERSPDADYEDESAVRTSMNAYLDMIEHLGLQPRFVSSEMIEHGVLSRNHYRMLLIPHVLSLSTRAAIAIDRFLSQGGTVIADGPSGSFDEHGRQRAQALLLPTEDAVRTNDGTVAPPLRLVRFVPLIASGKSSDGRSSRSSVLRHLLTGAGIRSRFDIATSTGAPVSDVETYRFRIGNARLVALQRDRGADPSSEESVVVSLPRAQFIYNVRTGRWLGHRDRLVLPVDPITPTLLALFESAPAQPQLHGPRRAHTGSSVNFAVVVPGMTPSAKAVVRVEITDPSGKDRTRCGVLILEGGRGHLRVRIPPSGPDGRWQVRVRDVLSGKSATAALAVSRD